jgi:hypothetical protein
MDLHRTHLQRLANAQRFWRIVFLMAIGAAIGVTAAALMSALLRASGWL